MAKLMSPEEVFADAMITIFDYIFAMTTVEAELVGKEFATWSQDDQNRWAGSLPSILKKALIEAFPPDRRPDKIQEMIDLPDNAIVLTTVEALDEKLEVLGQLN